MSPFHAMRRAWVVGRECSDNSKPKWRIPNDERPVEFPLDEQLVRLGATTTFVSDHRDLDIGLIPDGTQAMTTFDAARLSATQEWTTGTLQVEVANLADVIRSKEAAGRENLFDNSGRADSKQIDVQSSRGTSLVTPDPMG
jgi:hypothetical protein